MLGHESRPERHGKGVEGRQRGGEAARPVRQPLADQGGGLHERAGEGRGAARFLLLLARPLDLLRSVLANGGADERACADLRGDQPFGGQALVDVNRRGAGDAELARQGSARGQTFARLQPARENHIPQGELQLTADGLAWSLLDLEVQQQRPRWILDHRFLPKTCHPSNWYGFFVRMDLLQDH